MFKPCLRSGSVALEYVIVTTFAAFLAMTVLGVSRQILKDKISKIASQLNLDVSILDWDPFGDENP